MNDPGPRSGLNRLAPFPFTSMFQNGPRPQGSAPENLFKPTKDSPPPRKNPAPLTAAGRSEDFPTRRERGQMQRPNYAQLLAPSCLPMVGPQPAESDAPLSRNLIRPPPVDDVNNLKHDGKSRRCLASTAIQIRQIALFTSPEYAVRRLLGRIGSAVEQQLHRRTGAVTAGRDNQGGLAISRAHIHLGPCRSSNRIFSGSSTAHISAVAPASLRMLGSAPWLSSKRTESASP